MNIGDINQKLLDTLSIKDKSDLLARLKLNREIQKIVYRDEKRKYTNDYEK